MFAGSGNASIQGGDEIAVDERLSVVTALMQLVIQVQAFQHDILCGCGEKSRYRFGHRPGIHYALPDIN
jgi:hypothetical protein